MSTALRPPLGATRDRVAVRAGHATSTIHNFLPTFRIPPETRP